MGFPVPRFNSRRRLCIFLLVLVVVVLLGGCGKSTPSAVQTLATVDSRTLAGRTSRLAITVDTVRPGAANPTSRSQTAVFDYSAHRGHITNTATVGGAGPETLFIGNDIYTSVPPALAATVSGGKPWLKRSQLIPGGSGRLQQLLQPTDPIELLRAVRDITNGGGQKVGNEKIRGVDTYHFKLNVDPHRLPAAEPDPTRRAELTKRVAAAPKAVLRADLWVDHDGRARRLRTEVGLELLTGSVSTAPTTSAVSPGSLRVTTEWFDYGTTVNIQPPPPNQVADGAPGPGG